GCGVGTHVLPASYSQVQSPGLLLYAKLEPTLPNRLVPCRRSQHVSVLRPLTLGVDTHCPCTPPILESHIDENTTSGLYRGETKVPLHPVIYCGGHVKQAPTGN
ncbi:unnamed protein product, partial [Ectocarpus sp. 12 AP-2014]